MGAVVDFITDTVSDAFDAVGDVVDDVGEAVGSVVDKIGGVIEGVLANPLPVLLSIAGQMIGIPAPLTMGALTAAQGGSLEDVVLSAGLAQFGQQIGSSLSETFAGNLIEVGVNEVMAEVVSNAVSKGLINGTVAEIKGGDFSDAFSGGFTGGLVSAGVAELGEYVKPEFVEMANEVGLSMNDASAMFKAGLSAVSAGVTSEVTGRGDFATAFTNSAINSGVRAGVAATNNSIDEQFKAIATDWNEKDPQSQPVTTEATGGGIPDELVSQVEVSDIGFNAPPEQGRNIPIDVANPVMGSGDIDPIGADEPDPLEKTESVGWVAPMDETVPSGPVDWTNPADEVLLPTGETTDDFPDLGGGPDIGIAGPKDDMDRSGPIEDPGTPPDRSIIEDPYFIEDPYSIEDPNAGDPNNGLLDPVGGASPVVGFDPLDGASPVDAPAPGGLNTLAPVTKPPQGPGLSNFTRPLVSAAGSALAKSLTQGNRPRPPMMPPQGGLQAIAPQKKPAPAQMNIADLMPIVKATTSQSNIKTAPAQTLKSSAGLTPITKISGLSSLVKKAP